MLAIKEAVIISACRTPVGKFLGTLKSFKATELGAIVVRESVKREGMSGISTRFIMKALDNALSDNMKGNCINPINVREALINMVKEADLPDDTRKQFLEVLQDTLHKEYLELLEKEITRAFVFRDLPHPSPRLTPAHSAAPAADGGTGSRRFPIIATMFALASLASAAFVANLVPALGERDINPATAAMLGGLIGVMQLPGRALLMNGVFSTAPTRLLAVSLMLQALGLGAVSLAPSVFVAAGGITAFALGAGLTTLVRPHLIQTLFSHRIGGYLNGRIARHQQLARAAGPLAIAWLAGFVGYATVFVVIAGTFTVVALASHGVLDRIEALPIQKETI